MWLFSHHTQPLNVGIQPPHSKPLELSFFFFSACLKFPAHFANFSLAAKTSAKELPFFSVSMSLLAALLVFSTCLKVTTWKSSHPSPPLPQQLSF
jgi:hypothetical protein